MKTVGAYEAKTHLSRLLEEVAKGESIRITRHGAPVAVLVPASADPHARASETISELRAFRANRRLGRLSVKAMIEEGRR
jgi:prevent-host-death family protein